MPIDVQKYNVVGAILGKSDFVKRCNRMDVTPNSSQHQIKNGDILLTYIGMLHMNGIVPSKLPNGYVPVDIDVTPFDNSKTRKEGVSRTYKGYNGYAPIMAYIGTEGYLVNAQLREGKQHCQCGTPAFLRETIALCRQITDEPLLIRLDTGNDSAENIGILLESGCYFIIKRNLRRESKDGWFEMAKANSQNITIPREGKTVYT